VKTAVLLPYYLMLRYCRDILSRMGSVNSFLPTFNSIDAALYGFCGPYRGIADGAQGIGAGRSKD